MEKQMISKTTKFNVNLMKILIYCSILMISIFPIFGTNGSRIQNLVIWFTIFTGIIYYAFKQGLVINKFLKTYAIYIALSILSIIWIINLGGAYVRLMDMTKAFLFMVVISSSCKDKKDIFKYLDVFTYGVVIISIYCIISDATTLTSWARLGRKSFEIAGQNQIYYSCILIYSCMYSLFRAFYTKNNKFIYIIITLFLFACGLLTAIRKCLIIPVIFIIIYIILKNNKNMAKLFFISIVAIIFIGILYAVTINYLPSMSNRITSLVSDFVNKTEGTTDGNSYSQRKWLRDKAWEVFKENPIVGVGIGQFRFYAAKNGIDLYSHNNFLEVLANTGIIGFTIYYSSMLAILIKLFEMKKMNEKNEEYIFMISFMISTLIMEYGQVDYYQVFLLFIINLFSIYIDQKKYLIYYNKKE